MDDVYGSYAPTSSRDIWNGGGCVKDKTNAITRMLHEIQNFVEKKMRLVLLSRSFLGRIAEVDPFRSYEFLLLLDTEIAIIRKQYNAHCCCKKAEQDAEYSLNKSTMSDTVTKLSRYAK